MGPKKIVKSKSEWSERVVAIERVTKVVKGGKKMSFRAIIVVGNEQGKLGVGVGNWKIISIRYSRDIIAEYRVPYFVHNDFLQVTAEIGIFGGLAYMCFIFLPFFKSMSMLFRQKYFSIYFMIFLISGVFIIDSLLNFPLDRPINTTFFNDLTIRIP